MFWILQLLNLLQMVSLNVADIADLNCTVWKKSKYEYALSSTNCNNIYKDSVCESIYNTPKIAAGSTEDRPLNCYTSSATSQEIDQTIKEIAIATCPKTCGYCCETVNYNCENSRFPRIDCDTVTATMCRNDKFRKLLTEDCPKTCGFCSTEDCYDTIRSCEAIQCITNGLEDFVATHCRRTCGLCGRPNPSVCMDRIPSCEKWKANGFCSNKLYNPDTRAFFCRKTCGLCY